ncbi:pyridoxamine 5'-phosphate oxidase family protein [Candidatus Nitrosocosmicus arcticus]|uniref:Putative pyridoxamine 5'-phosphate oxidase n=1 Tax=Candidatus Nitrosocosmicus arcticus TaxID=2035267 RepID=A0A557SZI0_9ARCH|nr:pyridoxamine 5'-phosphate oxidase family protein [Candidatus Nitrosocosmicus arcticus]TVP42018.1 putative pyridoxamine 5'-phosphate oxidase [Candidatus Nitrosocosmicus arcticus]
MNIIGAITPTTKMNMDEVEKFLENKLNLQLATIDEKGDPNIQPIWFDYDKERQKLLVVTPRNSKKIQNLKKRNVIYFSIDDETFPYKGIKGKGNVEVIGDSNKTMPLIKKIVIKYLNTLEHPIATMILESAKEGNHVLVEISPRFFSTWDFNKL